LIDDMNVFPLPTMSGLEFPSIMWFAEILTA
jgi:hypothetical protein